MEKKKKSKKKSQKETHAKTESQKPAEDWRPILKGALHSISSGYLQNLLIGLVLLLVGPVVGMLVKSPKVAILLAATGLTLLTWIIAIITIRQVRPRHQAETEGAESPNFQNPTFREKNEVVTFSFGGEGVSTGIPLLSAELIKASTVVQYSLLDTD